MLFRRLGLRLLKLLLLIVLIWIGAALLYLSLPSPVPNDFSVTTSLRQGKPTYRVYNVDTFWPRTDVYRPVKEARRTGQDNFLMEYQYLEDLDILVFGGASDPLGINGAATHYHNFSVSPFTETDTSTSISRPIALDVPVTGHRSDIILPWMSTADGAVVYWWAHNMATRMTFVVRRVPSKRLIEIWPDSGHWYEPDVEYDESTPLGLEPLLSIQLEPLSFAFPSPPASSSPSAYYLIRVELLLFLLPLCGFASLIVDALPAIFNGILAICMFSVNIAAVGAVIGAVIYGIYWWMKNERPRMIISMADIQEGINRTLDNARARGEEMHEQESVSVPVDIEAQIETAESGKAPEVLFYADVKDGTTAPRA